MALGCWALSFGSVHAQMHNPREPRGSVGTCTDSEECTTLARDLMVEEAVCVRMHVRTCARVCVCVPVCECVCVRV